MLFFSIRQKRYLLFMFLIGVILGTVLMVFCCEKTELDMRIYGNYIFDTAKLNRVQTKHLFFYICKYRLKQAAILILFSLTVIRTLFYGMIGLVSGMRMGILISMLTLLDRKKAILNCIAIIFPHELVYMLAGLLLFSLSWNFLQEKNEKKHLFYNIKKVLITGLIFFVGILLEVYINPLFLKLVS